MSIRKKANEWFRKKYGLGKEPIYSSKFYQPEESWPKKSVWWPKIPLNEIQEIRHSHINLLCEVSPNSDDFHYLKVPTKYLNENLENFHTIGNLIDLYLSTEPKTFLIEIRGKGNLDFSQFLIKEK